MNVAMSGEDTSHIPVIPSRFTITLLMETNLITIIIFKEAYG
jgi:hypothetical protein